ncbi:hypothetical protein [Synechococcus sp. LA31]|uniref:hypothetical protein n=1 Tax=Synechococcus sp. LA31 TaxID=2741953 RepID=UPI001BDC943F|nr:hypothetical protein [Synechococcus sp. LA31]QVV66978.1 hypothetical protein KJJ24_10945 [Synechococcus sp. LA31]
MPYALVLWVVAIRKDSPLQLAERGRFGLRRPMREWASLVKLMSLRTVERVERSLKPLFGHCFEQSLALGLTAARGLQELLMS